MTDVDIDSNEYLSHRRGRVSSVDASCCEPGAQPSIDEAAASDLEGLFKALSDPIRVRLVALIAAQPDREVCACDLVDVLGRSQPTISHHLKQLHAVGLVDRERRGAWIHYRINDEVVASLTGALGQVFEVAEFAN